MERELTVSGGGADDLGGGNPDWRRLGCIVGWWRTNVAGWGWDRSVGWDSLRVGARAVSDDKSLRGGGSVGFGSWTRR